MCVVRTYSTYRFMAHPCGALTILVLYRIVLAIAYGTKLRVRCNIICISVVLYIYITQLKCHHCYSRVKSESPISSYEKQALSTSTDSAIVNWIVIG